MLPAAAAAEHVAGAGSGFGVGSDGWLEWMRGKSIRHADETDRSGHTDGDNACDGDGDCRFGKHVGEPHDDSCVDGTVRPGREGKWRRARKYWSSVRDTHDLFRAGIHMGGVDGVRWQRYSLGRYRIWPPTPSRFADWPLVARLVPIRAPVSLSTLK